MPYTLQLRTNNGCTAWLTLSGDQTVVEVSDRQGLVSSRPRRGAWAGWLPLELREAVLASRRQAELEDGAYAEALDL